MASMDTVQKPGQVSMRWPPRQGLKNARIVGQVAMSGASLQKCKKCRKVVVTGRVVVKALSNPWKKRTLKKRLTLERPFQKSWRQRLSLMCFLAILKIRSWVEAPELIGQPINQYNSSFLFFERNWPKLARFIFYSVRPMVCTSANLAEWHHQHAMENNRHTSPGQKHARTRIRG